MAAERPVHICEFHPPSRAETDAFEVWLERNGDRVGALLNKELEKIDPNVLGGVLFVMLKSDVPAPEGSLPNSKMMMVGMIAVGGLDEIMIRELVEAAMTSWPERKRDA